MVDQVFRDSICPHKMHTYLAIIKNQAKKRISDNEGSDPLYRHGMPWTLSRVWRLGGQVTYLE